MYCTPARAGPCHKSGVQIEEELKNENIRI